MGKLRVLVVEDSFTVRKRMSEALVADEAIDVVAEAEDGRTAIEMCLRHRPDVVTLDMVLPVMSGLAVTEYIMAHCPTPILIVSASTNRGDLYKTYDALAAGAVDVLDKPTGNEIDDGWEARLVAAVKLIARIKVITHPRARLGRMGEERVGARHPSVERAAPGTGLPRIVAIGASTGGPAAIVSLLRGLPPDFSIPIALVLHITPLFAPELVEWLDDQSPLRVAYARDGEPIPPRGDARVLVAPPDRHLVVREGRVRLTQDPERHSCRPSVDVLFESLAVHLGSEVAACLLTGMGRDGAEGLLAIRRAGGRTIAQDERTSVVFGMPREAIVLGAAEHVLALPDIPGALVSMAGAVAHRGAP